jgi:nucleotide-binding universal stress UspA family protein
MGEKIGEGVRATLLREYRTRAETAEAEITARAQRAGLVADGGVEEGDPTEIGPRLARSLHATTVVLVAERRSWLSRLLSGNPVRMPDLPGCEVRVVEEDE